MTYLGIKRGKTAFFFVAGLAFGIAIQLHYLALLLLLIFLAILILSSNWKSWPKNLSFYLVGAFITFSPFLLFEVSHGFPNFKTILEFVTRGTNVGYKNLNFLWLITNTGNIFLEEISRLTGTVYTKIILWGMLLFSAYGFYKNRKDKNKRLLDAIGIIWFFGGLLFLRLYTGNLNDYYFGFIFPAPFFLLGLIFGNFWSNKFFKEFSAIFTLAALFWFINNAFFKNPPNKLIDQTKDVAQEIIQKAGGKPYNFALIADRNSDYAYRYFLDIKGSSPTQLETMVTDQLIILCESQKCSPLGNPLWEIAAFGRGEIAGEWDLPKYGFKLYRLTHWTGEPSPAGKPAVKGG